MTLDLNDNAKDNLDDAMSLYTLSDDGLTVILRSDDKKGLKIVSLEDGSVVLESAQIHKKPIIKLGLMADQTTVVSVSKDRNVVAYDYITQTIVGQREDHTKPIMSFALTSCNRYVFTCAKDKQICVYYTRNWQLLCTLQFPTPCHEIMTTKDGLFLVAFNKNKKFAHYWQLTEATDSINLPLKKGEKINWSVITPNKEFMHIGYTQKGAQHDIGGFESWNLKSRVK